jgi:4-amino-4-deoxy-L-arabinose transferase-like glycosyltransferase
MPGDWARQSSGDPSLLYESLQPPLYYWLASSVLRLTARETLPGRVIAVRWFSVSLASLVVPLGFLLARRALRHDGLALGVVALVAAMPELMIDISRVANDTLAIPLYTLLVLLALKWLENPVDLKRSFHVGLALALGLLTKAYFLTAVPALAFIPVAALWRGRNRFRVFLNGLAAGVTPVLLAGWWYLRNHRSTGTWFWQPGAELIRGVPLTRVLGRAREVDWRNVLLSVQISHIWFGGWSFLQVRGWMYRIFWDIFLLACVGLVICAWRLLQRKDAHVLLRGADFLALLGFYSLFCLGLAYHALLMFILLHVSATDGWYLYCPVAVETILASAGLLSLLPRRYGRWVLPTGTFCFALLELYATHFLLIPYYTGMIAHRPNGGLTTFHVSMLKDVPVRVVIERLLVNKPHLLSEPTLLVIWTLFLLSTLSLIVISHGASRASQPNNTV